MKLSFVNKGQEFKLPYMTVELQEEIFDEGIEIEKKLGKGKKADIETNRLCVLRVLQLVDKTVCMDDIKKMHINDFVKLHNMIYETGGELSDADPNPVKE